MIDLATIAMRSARRARQRLHRSSPAKCSASGCFQPYNHTLPDRYPWLFEFVAKALPHRDARLLSYGCSLGDEILSLRKYFPHATIRGLDVDSANIATCHERCRDLEGVSFATAATTVAEPSQYYDAIFCLAVLVHGDLTVRGTQTSDPLFHFSDFSKMVKDFTRCLKPGGLLCLHTTNFRFCDTDVAKDFDVLLDAEPYQLASDVKFDRNNRLMRGVQYQSVVFRLR